MKKTSLEKSLREKLLKGEVNLQTKDEYYEYKKIPPNFIIKGLEETAIMMNKMGAAFKNNS